MGIRFSVLLGVPLALICCVTSYAQTDLQVMAERATSPNVIESSQAIAQLRSMGPTGLDALFECYRGEIEQQASGSPPSAAWQRITLALDEVSQQKDSYLSHLYWYTDLSKARQAAEASGKPILSLRLLGKLNDEFSCANSRFFRTVLYPNRLVSDVLREDFILHWQSVRPAPRITIDFGDGRRLERTVTGNSIHYILNAKGQVVDAVPGLYGPKAFISELRNAHKIFRQLVNFDEARQQEALDKYHRGRMKAVTDNWIAEVGRTGGKIPETLLPRDGKGKTSAIDVAPLAVTKMVTEVSILRRITRDVDALSKVTDEESWTRIAALHANDAVLDFQSKMLIKNQSRNLLASANSKEAAERLMDSLTESFQRSIALDTVRNEYVLHNKLHAWLIVAPGLTDVDTFNEKVYSELFLTPKSDPWLGMYSPEIYVALENGGLVSSVKSEQ